MNIAAIALIAALPALALPISAMAAHRGGNNGLEACLASAAEIKRGAFVKVEYLKVTPGGIPTYEVEVRDGEGTEWEFMCNARTGAIYEFEREVADPGDALFAGAAKVSKEQAIAKATAVYPGQVCEVEYEIEADGGPTYEIDIEQSDGTEFKVEVDAVSGSIIEVAYESWEIGGESDECL